MTNEKYDYVPVKLTIQKSHEWNERVLLEYTPVFSDYSPNVEVTDSYCEVKLFNDEYNCMFYGRIEFENQKQYGTVFDSFNRSEKY